SRNVHLAQLLDLRLRFGVFSESKRESDCRRKYYRTNVDHHTFGGGFEPSRIRHPPDSTLSWSVPFNREMNSQTPTPRIPPATAPQNVNKIKRYAPMIGYSIGSM